jgi:hypothetical protein
MTLKYMQGFETMLDDSDLRAMGWAPNPSKSTARNTVTVPSVTGISGLSIRPQGPFQSPLSGTAPGGGAAANDWGYFNTGITVNQAWTAGGVTLGFGAAFNSGTAASFAAGATTNNSQACFDGTRYWAIRLIGSTYAVCYSTNLTTWSVAPAQPTLLNYTSQITSVGSGVVAVSNVNGGTYTVFSSSNQGSSWTSTALAASGVSTSVGITIATGNATYPHATLASAQASGATNYGIYVGTLGGTMSLAIAFPSTGGAVGPGSLASSRLIGGLLVFAGSGISTGAMAMGNASSASLNTSAAWTTSTFAQAVVDVAYNPTSNLWVFACTTGMFTIANTGAPGTPVALSGALTLTSRYSTVGMTNVYWTGSQLVATGQQGHIITSPDGITWTETGGHLLPVGVSGSDWRSVINDGSRYVMYSDATTGLIATTPDLLTNYKCVYAMESSEVVQAIATTMIGTGLYPASSAPSLTTGQWSQPIAATSYMVIGSLSSNTRPVAINRNDTGASIFSGSLSAGPGSYHYYELHYVKSAATTNTFTLSIYVDGSLLGTASTATAFAPTSDTTSLLVISFQRNGIFTAFDDIYVTLDDGVANTLQGPVGVINIVAQRPETDVQAQWAKTGSAASNSLSMNQTSLSAQSTNYTSSNNAGDKDLYGTTDALPSGYTPKAIQVEAYYTKTSSTAPVVNVGIVSGGSEVDGTQVTINNATPTYVSQIVERNPNGNTAWTASTVNAAQFVNNHVA